MSLFSQLKRRNVFRVAIAYVVLAWVMAQVAELLLDAFGAPPWVLKSVLALFILALPFVIFFSWTYELTPEGIKRERDVDRGESIVDHTARRLDRIIIVLLVLALAAFAWDRFAPVDRESPPPALAEAPGMDTPPPGPAETPAPVAMGPPDESIAVLPFANMSEDPDNEFFSYGISEEVLNLLARLPGLHVTSRSSSFQFKGEDVHIPTVARQLGVAHVLEGSVRKSGNRVRITAQLIDAGADRHLWSDTWDRELVDIFAIQDEIAAAVVDALQETLLGSAGRTDLGASQRTDARAYELYLRGRYLTWERTPEALDEAVRLLEQAIEIDPKYAPANAGLGLALYFRTNVAAVDGIEVFRQADAAISRALELDPESWEAYEARGLLRSDQGRFEEARAALEKAIELNPNDARAWYWLSRQYANSDPVRALELAQRAYAINPLARIVVAGLAWSLRPLGRYEEAMAQARTYRDLFPESNWAFRTAADIYAAQGRYDLALKSIFAAYRSQPRVGYGFLSAPSLILGLGEADLARAWLAEVEAVTPLWGDIAFRKTALLGFAGETERAIQVAEDYARLSDDPSFDDALALAHAVGGDFATARRVLERARPGLAEEPPRWDPEIWFAVSNYAVVLQRTESADRAARLLDELQDLVEAQIAAGVEWSLRAHMYEELAILYSLQGRTREALEAFGKAEQGGGALCIVCFAIDPAYDGLRGVPEFEALVARQQARLDAQRRNLADEGLLLTPAEVLALEKFEFDPLGR